MALQKKKYRSSLNRSRGKGTEQQVRAPYAKDYARNVRSFHGSKTDEVQENLSKEIVRKKTHG